jgi:hypothetical protein
MVLSRVARVGAVAVVALVAGCQTYQSDLARAQTAFEQNDEERALAIFRLLEPDLSHLSTPERAQFAYLRGMTDYRIGYKIDARHWLAIAKALDDGTPGLLPGDWKSRMTDALDELDEGIYGGGIESLSNAKGSGGEPKKAEPKPKSEDVP